ncbi:MAG TPA: PIN domain-containing protein [Nitrospirae bacterium]|nr:PIN domain-containing protein [Nitrospirota bacterium]
MKEVLVDSNVILDLVTEDKRWCEWSSATLSKLAGERVLVINQVIYAEVSIGFDKIEDLDVALPIDYFRRDPVPWEAAFLAGKSFLRYRKSGGARRSPLPDFFIGAHAAVKGMELLTRDISRYSHYFPKVPIITP